MVRGLSVVCVLFVLCQSAFASEAPTTVVTRLKWMPNVASLAVNSIDYSTTFTKEPDFGKHHVIRETAQLGSARNERIAIAYDRDANLLYADMNYNGDLTDETTGVIRPEKKGGEYDVRETDLPLVLGLPPRKYNVHFWAYGEMEYVSFAVRSGWSGSVELGGQKYLLRVMDNGDGIFAVADRMQVIPSSLADEITTKSDYFGVSAQDQVFLKDHLYSFNFGFVPAGDVSDLETSIGEVAVECGKIDVKGDYIAAAILPQRPGRINTILEQPSGVVTVPVGKYDYSSVLLERAPGKLQAFSVSKTIRVTSGSVTTAAFGAPLRPSVEVDHLNGSLDLQYKLVSADNSAFTSRDQTSAPQFAIYKGGTKLLADSFSYG